MAICSWYCFVQAHLVDGRASAGASVDSARQNLAATFVNAFVNAGFGQVTHLSLCCVLGVVGIG
jgi:hypothetical protein